MPRWARATLLMGALSGTTFLVAQLTYNWTIAPTAVFLGAAAGPFGYAVWLTDRTRIGRSVPPDVLFTTWLVGGGIAIVFAGVFESSWFYRPSTPGYLWIGLVEETAKVVTPLAICTVVPRYRSVEKALALAIVTAGGFAMFESMTYALEALDESVGSARRVLLQRLLVTPFAHLPWTGLAVVVAATAWQAAGRPSLSPKALWGLGAAILLHTAWNVALVREGWWYVATVIAAIVTYVLFHRAIAGVCYAGPDVARTERPAPRRQSPADRRRSSP